MSIEITRERVIQALCAHYAQDRLTTDELDSRLERAQKAASEPQLAALVVDLPALPDLPVPGVVGAPALPLPDNLPARRTPSATVMRRSRGAEPVVDDEVERAEHQRYIAVMFGIGKKGVWVPPRHMEIFCFWGGAALDFREAIFPSGVTEIDVTCVMGGAEILVPPGVRLEVSGSGLMGGFDETGYGGVPIGPGAPVIRINGLAIMGGVEVSVRYPGESGRDAKRREKEEHRLLRGG